MEVSYRSPQIKDFNRLAEIYNHAIRETAATFDTEEKSPDHFEKWTTGQHLYRMKVAEVKGEVVAYAGTYPFSQRQAYDELAEVMLYVHPDWQRRGIGSALLKEIHQDDFMAGYHTTMSLINKDNTYMHRAFEKLGYLYRGEIIDAGVKFGRRHSIVIYQLMRSPAPEK